MITVVVVLVPYLSPTYDQKKVNSRAIQENLDKHAAQVLAMPGKGSLLALTQRLSQYLLIRPERLLGCHHGLQFLFENTILPILATIDISELHLAGDFTRLFLTS